MSRKRNYPDHARAWALLWRGEDEPSARSGLTVTRIGEAGIELADRDGLAALSMRRVAEHLGVGTMSLYTYVPGKDELIFVMVEAVRSELPPLEGEGWRESLESIAYQNWELYHRHPWLLEVPVTRPVVGPVVMERNEAELRAVDGMGLSEIEMDAAIGLVHNHVAATARKALEIARDAERSGMTDDQWWYAVLPTLTKVLANRNLPITSRVGEAIGAPHSDPRHDLEFGLRCILDGIEARIISRSPADRD